mmetsp:Transcript_9993/g.24728  ORF Transcript_9993/g.24728 Transcript_9993/m.24728 type:complete len:245 (-) Transcript_9993:255-989(-)
MWLFARHVPCRSSRCSAAHHLLWPLLVRARRLPFALGVVSGASSTAPPLSSAPSPSCKILSCASKWKLMSRSCSSSSAALAFSSASRRAAACSCSRSSAWLRISCSLSCLLKSCSLRSREAACCCRARLFASRSTIALFSASCCSRSRSCCSCSHSCRLCRFSSSASRSSKCSRCTSSCPVSSIEYSWITASYCSSKPRCFISSAAASICEGSRPASALLPATCPGSGSSTSLPSTLFWMRRCT